MSKHTLVAALVGLGLVASPALALAAPAAVHRPAGVNARQHRQTARIKDGVEDHELTRGELDKLRADEAGVRAEERVFRQSGGGLNTQESKDLQRDLNKTSREIYRAKHNNREPGTGQ